MMAYWRSIQFWKAVTSPLRATLRVTADVFGLLAKVTK